MQSEVRSLSIRPADFDRPGDARAVVEILDAYSEDLMGASRPLDKEVKARLVPALREVPGALVLLATSAQGPAGILVAFQGFSTFFAAPVLNIHDLAVLRQCRRRGVGRALLAAAEREARRRGCCKMTLEVREDNAPAALLYDNLGFRSPAASGYPIPHWFLEKRL